MASLLLAVCGSGQVLPTGLPDPPRVISPAPPQEQMRLQWAPYPAAERYDIISGPHAHAPFTVDLTGTISGSTWTAPLTGSAGFYRLQVTPLDAHRLLTATVLNRLAYGPTPDEWERVNVIGPQAYIQEQLAPEYITEQLDFDTSQSDSDWQHITATGKGSSSVLYLYLTSPGEGFIDDIQLVAGTVPVTGANLVRNGDFEAPLATNDWTVSGNLVDSEITSAMHHSGNASLHVVAARAGSSQSTAIWQTIRPALSAAKTYTLSYWYLPSASRRSSLTVRLSGSSITSKSDSLRTRLDYRLAAIDDLRAWHLLRAVRSQRQLLEVLLQFLENHFVTQYSKSADYFNAYYRDSGIRNRMATQLEFKENQRWRQALLNPACTFHDLLRISAESPAMIIYLDTVNSKGNGSNVANENYARELLELFTFGVDNGYDQNDITVMSRGWTGWSVNIVDAAQEGNPLALRTTNLLPGVTRNLNAVSNLAGVWTFNYRSGNHNTNAKKIFPGKTVPDRFGPPYAGHSYELNLPARNGTNGIQDGYAILTHLANQPFTQEYISVKLCQLFVHEDFDTGYDFNDPNLPAEGQLVRQCMLAWENSSPKGQLRPVLATIFNADLFRGHAASVQKLKTPLEFTVSAIRALRVSDARGGFTADTDGFALVSPMHRMGGMRLFDRDDPDGYPEMGSSWISTGTLAERLRFVQSLLIAPGQSGKADSGEKNTADPVGLLQKKLPSTQWNDASAVADYFLRLLYPAEGKANLDLYLRAAIHHINTADDGEISSPLSGLTVGSSAYDLRVRSLVAMLLTLPRFQEQ